MSRDTISSVRTACFVLGCSLLALGQTPDGKLSPAEKKIAATEKAIQAHPDRHPLYADLAIALSQRAREISDPSYYVKAEQALEKSFELKPDNYEASKAQVWILLGKHEFAQALEKAKALNKKMPDDVMIYGFLTDANIELGNYKEAEASAQWMLDLRPGNVPAFTRAAYLRELFGDVEGSLELMSSAAQRTGYSELEDRAWIMTQIAHLRLSEGKLDEADRNLEEALQLFPDYHYAVANLAKVRMAQKRYPDAIALLRKRYQAAPHAENLYDLAEALDRAGDKSAASAYAEFEQKSRKEMDLADNSNHELVFYYADHAHKPAEALRIAKQEFARRHDVYTLDAYAWALHVNGNDKEARQQIESALAVGIRNATLFYHAGTIAAKTNDKAAATKYLKQAVALQPWAPEADTARKILAKYGTSALSS